jgi:branched-chain amino acid transport system substrate-binding protein
MKPQPDFIYGNTFYPNVAALIKQIRNAGIDLPIVGSQAYSSLDFPKAVGADKVHNVYYITQAYYEGEDVEPDMAAILTEYKKKFGQLPGNVNFISGYQVMLAIEDAVKKAGTTKGKALSEALSNQKHLNVPGSTIARWDNGHAVRSVSVISFDEKGNFREVDRFIPTEQ